jgi:hypothetical protein
MTRTQVGAGVHTLPIAHIVPIDHRSMSISNIDNR